MKTYTQIVMDTFIRCKHEMIPTPCGVIMHPSTYADYLAQDIIHSQSLSLPRDEIVPGVKIFVTQHIGPGNIFFVYPHEA